LDLYLNEERGKQEFECQVSLQNVKSAGDKEVYWPKAAHHKSYCWLNLIRLKINVSCFIFS
jgi:hypothetical protein